MPKSTKLALRIGIANTPEERDRREEQLRKLAALVVGSKRNKGNLSALLAEIGDWSDEEINAIAPLINYIRKSRKKDGAKT